ncbi:hypothetical protein ACTXT7_014081 [Hymenolepis weldensis]
MKKILGHPILGFESFMGESQILLEDVGSSIGHTVYPRRLNNGLKNLHMGICICIDFKALPSQHRKNHHCWWKHRAHNSWNFSGVRLHIATYPLFDLIFPPGGSLFGRRKTEDTSVLLGVSVSLGVVLHALNESLELFCPHKLTLPKNVRFVSEVLMKNIPYCSLRHLKIFGKMSHWLSRIFVHHTLPCTLLTNSGVLNTIAAYLFTSLVIKTKVSQATQRSVDLSQLYDVFNRLSEEIKLHSVKFEGSKYVDSSITSMSSVPSSHSIKPSVSDEILDAAFAEDIIKNVSEFINDPKSANSLNCDTMSTNLCSWRILSNEMREKRKLGPVEYESYSKFVLHKEFDELSYSETVQIMGEVSGQNFSLFYAYFN